MLASSRAPLTISLFLMRSISSIMLSSPFVKALLIKLLPFFSDSYKRYYHAKSYANYRFSSVIRCLGRIGLISGAPLRLAVIRGSRRILSVTKYRILSNPIILYAFLSVVSIRCIRCFPEKGIFLK